MFTTQFGLFWIFLLSCCNKSQAKLDLKNRTSVTLAGREVVHKLIVTVPANSTMYIIECYHNNYKVWDNSVSPTPNPYPQQEDVVARIYMHNSSCSGEYYFKYNNEKFYWVALVRDVGYQPDTESSVVPLLVAITIVLLLVSVIGSVYIFMWCKKNSSSKDDGNIVKAKKRKRNTVVTKEAKPDSVYTALNHKTVSVYDVLNVDEVGRTSRKSQTSRNKESGVNTHKQGKNMQTPHRKAPACTQESNPDLLAAKPSSEEEGIFESVYENL